MSKGHIHFRYCQATTEELGVRINPHLMRKIVATGVAVSMPEDAKIIPDLLDHADDRTSREHYILAGQLHEGRRHLALLRSRRAKVSGLQIRRLNQTA
jgi:integrase